jgi:hypothetical protein
VPEGARGLFGTVKLDLVGIEVEAQKNLKDLKN